MKTFFFLSFEGATFLLFHFFCTSHFIVHFYGIIVAVAWYVMLCYNNNRNELVLLRFLAL